MTSGNLAYLIKAGKSPSLHFFPTAYTASYSHCLISVYEDVIKRNSRLSDWKLKERLNKKYARSLRV